MRPTYEFLHDDRRANIVMQTPFALKKIYRCQHNITWPLWALLPEL